MSPRLAGLLAHAAAIVVFLAAWEYAAESGFLDPTFFGRPWGISLYLWGGFIVSGKLWLELRLARRYTGSTGYLKATVEGAARVDLDGQAAGTVTMCQAEHAQRRLAKIAERVTIKPKATTLAAAKPAGAAKGSVNEEAAAKGKTTATPTVDAPQPGPRDLASLISSGLRQCDGRSAAADPGYQRSVSGRAGVSRSPVTA